jgi:Holliday junction resolvasome RuvABC DNA-binding subunit
MISDARRALTQLGFRPAESATAVERAALHVGRDATLESLIRAALRACPPPTRT